MASAYLAWTTRRLSLSVGVSSPVSAVHSAGSNCHRFTCCTGGHVRPAVTVGQGLADQRVGHQHAFDRRGCDVLPARGNDQFLLPVRDRHEPVRVDRSDVPGVSGTWSRTRRRQETVELMRELPLAQLCTHVFDFGDAAEAFRVVDQGIPGLMHAVLNYERSAAGDL